MTSAQICSWPTGRNTACQRSTKDESGRCPNHRNMTSVQSASPLSSANLSLLDMPSTSQNDPSIEGDGWIHDMKATLRAEQREVADESFKVFVDPDQDRCQVRAACGMGKTMMEQAAIRKYDFHLQEQEERSGRYLYVVPTINLAEQMKKDLIRDGVLDIEFDESSGDSNNLLVVHSDSSHMKKGSGADSEAINNERIKSFLKSTPEEGEPKIVICVLDSVHKIAKVQKESPVEFDIAMFDEAHNYASNLVQTRDNMDGSKGNGKILPIYFNEQPEAIQATNRMFLTASPKTQSHLDETRLSVRESRNPKDKIIHMDNEIRTKGSKAKVDEFSMTQTDAEVFGNFIGNDGIGWGYQYAVDKGYLSKIDVKIDEVRAWDVNRVGGTVTRDTKVSPAGIISDSDEGVTLGTYASIRSTAIALATSNGRNTLSFSDSIEEAQSMETHWKEYVSGEAAAHNGYNQMSTSEAWDILDSGQDQAEPNVWVAARLQMLSESASIISTSSKATKETKAEAEDFFDKKVRGDKGDCKCGKPGGKCYCVRIVSNVDMLSEGISINSIDTVVLNRPSRMSDSDITQAVGRASRVFRDENGDNQKLETQVIVPRMVNPDVDGQAETIPVHEKGFMKPLRAINRIVNDTIGDRLNRKGLDINYSDPSNQRGVPVTSVSGDYHGDTVSEVANKIAGTSYIQASNASRTLEAWESWERRAKAGYKKTQGSSPDFESLSGDQKFQYVKDFALSYGGKTTPAVEQTRRVAGVMQKEVLDAQKVFLDDLYDRAARKDVVYGNEIGWENENTRSLRVKDTKKLEWDALARGIANDAVFQRSATA